MIVRARTTAALAAAALLLVGACGADDEPAPAPASSPSADAGATPEPEATDDAGVTIDITLAEDGPDPQGERVEVTAGEPVTLNVTSEISDEVHVHSDPEVSIDVEPGDEKSETFTIDRPGQVAVESHETHATIVQLVVRP